MTVLRAGGGSKDSAGTHVLVIPFPSLGHIIPLLDLVRFLACRGLFVTIAVTPERAALLEPLTTAHPSSIETLVLPLPSEDPEQCPPTGSTSPRDLVYRLSKLREPIMKWFTEHLSPPSVILSDMFLGWTHHLALELGIKRIVFSPSGALFSCTVLSLWREMPRVPSVGPAGIISFPNIPNSPKYLWWQLSGMFRAHVEGDPVSEFIKEGFLANMESWGLVINTFDELERAYLDHLRKELGHDRVWSIGPLLPPEFDLARQPPVERGGPSSVSVREIFSWLDSREDGCVVYVCFGSLAKLDNGQIEQLALGLEKSGVHFIWVVGDNGSSLVPPGFEDSATDRALLIRGWAPQLAILNHRAVGSFLTHCGWNSVLEGIVAGVPMLAWPMKADQFADATLIVDELKVAKRVCEGPEAAPNSDELAQAIAESVGPNWFARDRAAELRRAALQAIEDGGSSNKDLGKFIKQVNML